MFGGQSSNGGLFGSQNNAQSSNGGLFGGQNSGVGQTSGNGGSLFGGPNNGSFGGGFGAQNPGSSNGGFGGSFAQQQTQNQTQTALVPQNQQSGFTASRSANPTTQAARSKISEALKGVQRFGDVLKELTSWNLSLAYVHEMDGHEEELDSFEDALMNRFVPQIANLLRHPERDTAQKEKVSNMDSEAVDVISVLRLADELELAELEALNLWDCAYRKSELPDEVGVSFDSSNTFSVAVHLFYHKRNLELSLLQNLIPFFSSNSEDQIGSTRIREITGELLINHKLGEVMLKRISMHNTRISVLLAPQSRNLASLNLQIQYLQKERRHIAETIFALLNGVIATNEETLGLISLVREMSVRWLEDQQVSSHEQETMASYEAHFVLMLALAAALDRLDNLYDRFTQKVGPKPVRSESIEFIERCELELDLLRDANTNAAGAASSALSLGSKPPQGTPALMWGGHQATSLTTVTSGANAQRNGSGVAAKWKHQGVHGATILLWGAFIGDLRVEDFPRSDIASKTHRNDTLNQGYKLRGLAYFRGLLRSAEFIQDDLRNSYISILCSFARKLVTANVETALGSEMLKDLYSTRSREALRLREERSNYSANNAPSSSTMLGAYGRPPANQYGQLTSHNSNSRPFVQDKEAFADTLEDLLGFLRAIRVLESNGSYCLWYDSELLRNFLTEVNQEVEQDNDPTSLYVAYLGFLSTIAQSKEDAKFLLHPHGGSTAPPLDFSKLFSVLETFVNQLAEQQQQQQQSGVSHLNQQELMPLADQLVLTCWLEALNSCLTYLPAIEVLHECPLNQFVNYVTTMLRCRLEPALKGQIIRSLSLVAKSLPADRNLWTWLDSDAQVNTNNGSWGMNARQPGMQMAVNSSMLQPAVTGIQNGAVGFLTGIPTIQEAIRLDLNHSEAVNNVYPLTNSYLHLIWKLLTDVKDDNYRYLEGHRSEANEQSRVDYMNSSGQIGGMSQPFIPYSNGTYNNTAAPSQVPNQRSGMLPYLEYTLFEVFLKLDHRKFRDSGEKWRLAAGCLRIFVQILSEYTVNSEAAQNDFNASQTYSTGFWVMAKLLEGSAFFRQLLDLIKEAGGQEGIRERRESTSTAELQQYASEIDSFMPETNQYTGPMGQFGQHTFSMPQSSQGKKPWFVVTSHRAYSDVRNSSVAQGEAPGAQYGVPAMRSEASGSTPMKFYDGGRFASWLSQPHAAGWSSALRLASDQTSSQVRSYEQVEGKWYGWDDGDLGGRWREHAVRLALRLLKQVSEREEWFFEGIHRSDVSLESRLERLHRLFTHQKDRLPTIAAFCGYPYSAEMRMNSIELLFRLSEQSPTGLVVKALHRNQDMLVENLTRCFKNSFGDEANQATENMNFNPNIFEPIEDETVTAPDGDKVLNLDQVARMKMRKRIIILLIQGLTLSRGNVSELVLGLHDIATRSSPYHSIDLRPNRLCCLNAIVDVLEEVDFDTDNDTSLTELMYRLVLSLCRSKPTEIAMSFGLNTQRNNFWLRHFKLLASDGPKSDDANFVQCVAWVMNGVYSDLCIARLKTLPSVTLNDMLEGLFSSDLGRGEVDEADARIHEVLMNLSTTFPSNASLSAHVPDICRSMQQNARPLWIPFQEYHGLMLYKVNEDLIRAQARDLINSQADDMNKKRTRFDLENALEWAEGRNRAIDLLVARAEIVSAWRAIVKLSFVDCREELIRACNLGSGDHQLLVNFCMALLTKLKRTPDAHVALAYPLASLVPSLIAQMRYGDEDPQSPMSANEMALAAATGSFNASFSCGEQQHLKNSSRDVRGLARLSREEQRSLLEGIIEALRSRARMGTSAESVSPDLRAALYTAICVLVNGERRYYAINLANQFSQLPQWISEREFLSSAEEFESSDELQELRKRARSTLDTLHVGERLSLLEIVVPDALESESPMARVTGLATLKILLECDSDDGIWLSRLRQRGVLRQLLSGVVDRICADRLIANAQVDKFYELSMAVLTTAARSPLGAQAIVKSDFLQRLSNRPLVVLCDKRSLDAWANTMSDDSEMNMNSDSDGTTPSGESLQERRHDLVLPLLRFLTTLFTTLRASRRNTGTADLAQLQKDVLCFFRVQKRMVASSVGFSPIYINDIEEISLILSLLAQAMRDNNHTTVRELGSIADEFDTLVFDLIREICSPQPQRGEWKDIIQPGKGPESKQRSEVVTAPPDFSLMRRVDSVSLFQLDVFSQQRRLLQHAIMYARARRDAIQLKEDMSMGRNDPRVHALILCLDYTAHCLAALSRSSPNSFTDALSEHRKPQRSVDANSANSIASWSQYPQYAQWSCSTLLFIFEGSLVVLFARLKQISSAEEESQGSTSATFGSQAPSTVRNWLAHDKLLANYFDPAKEKSPIEQLEEVVKSNSSSSQFIHLMLRRMRDLA